MVYKSSSVQLGIKPHTSTATIYEKKYIFLVVHNVNDDIQLINEVF